MGHVFAIVLATYSLHLAWEMGQGYLSGRPQQPRDRRLIVTFAVMALADVGRVMRFVAIVFGAWVIAAPWLLAGATSALRLSDVIVSYMKYMSLSIWQAGRLT